MRSNAMVRAVDIRKTRKGDRYASLRLSLGAAASFTELDARIWDLDRLCQGRAIPAPGDLLALVYHEEEYNGRPQWIVEEFELVDEEGREALLGQFIAAARIDIPFYRARLDELIDQTDPDRAAGMLLRMVFERAGFREQFYAAPAARDHHQNYAGGLLEHTINVTSVALALADAYAGPGRTGLTFNSRPLPVDRPVLIAAGLLHDIGKIETYCMTPLPEVTEAQRWEGHLVISYAQVRELARPLLDRPPHPGACDEINKLLHCILAHHGQLDYGSPVVPACAEAFLLAQADMTDARLAEIAELGHEALDRDSQSRWLPRSFHFGGGLFIGDWPRGGAGRE